MKHPGLIILPAVLLFMQCAHQTADGNPVIFESGSAKMAAMNDNQFLLSEQTPSVSDPSVIIDALSTAYPDRIRSLNMRDGDWSLMVNGTALYWAEGRLLPLELREEYQNYSPYSFRPNPTVLPPLRVLSDAEKERLKTRIGNREARQDSRNPMFMNALWGMESFGNAEDTAVHVNFLGSKVRIHPELQQILAAVEADILKAAGTDAAVSHWLKQLREVGAYVWRDIAGSANRSLHSYGIAIDLVPFSYEGKQAYWRWTSDLYDEWWAIPYSDRFQIPPPVVQAFENHGFIWGGKWMLFDQIHFEYRPELVILGRMADSR